MAGRYVIDSTTDDFRYWVRDLDREFLFKTKSYVSVHDDIVSALNEAERLESLAEPIQLPEGFNLATV